MTTPCTFPDCGRPSRRRGLCHTHYEQDRMGVPLQPIRSRTPQPCIVDGCPAPSRARGMCHAHYQRVQTGVPLDRPIQQRGPRRLTPSKSDRDRLQNLAPAEVIRAHARVLTIRRAIRLSLGPVTPSLARRIDDVLAGVADDLRNELDRQRTAA